MAIEAQPDSVSGVGNPGQAHKRRNFWLGQGIHTAVIGAVIGYVFGHWLGSFLAGGYQAVPPNDNDDFSIVLGYAFGVLGWLIGLGVFDNLVRQMLGKPVRVAEEDQTAGGLAKYFRYSLDHKVVGLQYLFAMVVYFLTGGLFAIAIRTELLSPSYHVLSANAYLEVVGEHGTMMMMMMTSVVIGPFGNYLVPLMIGSKRVAFPRIEALSFWLTPMAYIVLLSSILFGGFPTGWTGYAPLSIQAGEGMDGYAVAFGLMAISATLASFNIVCTIICYRAPGMRWSRLPMFVWAMLTTGLLLVLAAPVLLGGLYMLLTDRTVQTAFFTQERAVTEDLFWFFGHPEVYILALPGFGVVSEILPVFTRKPLFGYRVGAAGMFGVAILSFFVWQHHLFDSGMDPDMRPLFMLTTELISIPTGFIYLVAMGTFWKAKIRLTVPMLFAIALFINFLFGGISGVFLSDMQAEGAAPLILLRAHALPLHDRGRPDLRLLRCHLLLAAEGHGDHDEREAGQDPLLDNVHRVQLHVHADVRHRPRRHAAPRVGVPGEPADAQRLGVDQRLRPGRQHVHLHLQLRDVHGRLAHEGAAEPVERTRPGVAGPVPAPGRQLRLHPGGPGGPVRVRRPGCPARG